MELVKGMRLYGRIYKNKVSYDLKLLAAYIYIYICVCVYLCIHTHTHTHTHTRSSEMSGRTFV